MKSLHARLEALRAKKATVALPPEERRKGIVWVRPALVAEVEYGNRTADGILRHAVYKGLRLDKAEDESARKAPEPPPVERKRYVTDADLARSGSPTPIARCSARAARASSSWRSTTPGSATGCCPS